MILKQAHLNEILLRDGYVLLDADMHKEVAEIERYIRTHFKLPHKGFYYSLLNNDPAKNKEINDHINLILEPFYQEFFTECRILTQSFLAKMAHTQDELFLHQDWSYTDETKYQASNIWIPLRDVTAQDGAMFFLPGSHLWLRNLRSGSLPTLRASYTEFPPHAISTIEMRRGQVLVFHPAVFHGSHPNTSAEDRIVVTATAFQHSAPFLYYDLDQGSDSVAVYQLDDEAFLRSLPVLAYGGAPAAPAPARIPYHHRAYTSADLLKIIEASL